MSKLKTLAAATALLSGVSTSALAQEVTYRPADANQDGITSESEWREHNAPKEGNAKRVRAAGPHGMSAGADSPGSMDYDDADSNLDGFVDRDEWDRYQRSIDRMMERRERPHVEGEASYRDADLNRDGVVSREEWNEYRISRPVN